MAALWRMDFERDSREVCCWAHALVQVREDGSFHGEEGQQWGEVRHSGCTLEIRAVALWAEEKKLHV